MSLLCMCLVSLETGQSTFPQTMYSLQVEKKVVTLQGRKLVDAPFTKWSRWTSPDMRHWEGHNVISGVFLPKIYSLNLIMRKQERPNVRDYL